ncbi:MAG TPA: type II methionyl aminopeptidase [Candidatus Nanopusillus sp.]|nr:type II methionyl aminopeptidase [Candidatus Nanopusillus sp.]
MIIELKKAGKIAKNALRLSEKLLKPETPLLEIADTIEQYIIDHGGYPAFPVNISINDVAAHYTPNINDKSVIREGDVVKVDLGVHIEGWIVDAAITIEINDSKYKELIKASKEALDSIRKILKKGISISEVGSVIERTITNYGFKPIYNLSGHKIDRYILHAGINIPNYNNKAHIQISDGIYAVEPFATNGVGYVRDGPGSTIYILQKTTGIRIPSLKKFVDEIFKKYRTLPFAKRWLYRDFGKKYNIDLYVNLLKKNNILYEYPILVEKSGGIVSQWETTFYINEGVQDLLSED